ncbi:hypothetical protein M408DRAFT_301860 [Serendipita vermifera MAFF 305830]|uniref:Uncharacterized protein n=1 Tax=Serendipita vermifera MAFF 305830 TaxID=933852 RepID=A0A0C2W5H3_SERVB|nr:hypothetical protein M408DRAFT_301860 [Serendipita vermifera MAFF 305830]
MRIIMHRLGWDNNPSGFEESARPCQHFDLIGGSGTGGSVFPACNSLYIHLMYNRLLAIMFTRLRMSVEEASDEFFTITEEVYKQDGLESSERSKRLRQCVGDMLQRRGFPLDTKLMEETPRNGSAGYANLV